MTVADIDGTRLLRRLHELATIGRNSDGGVTRPGFGESADDAYRYVAKEARDAGLTAKVDAGGNLLIRLPGPQRKRTLLLGSHLDTVMSGGWLDGAYGVIAALETLQTVADHHVDLGCDVAAVAFANEEGALFPQAFWGSMVLSGQLDALPKEPLDFHGNPLRPALARAGGDLDALAGAVWPAHELVGYLELHIEQGPVLESRRVPIGIVDVIVGRAVLEVDFHGRAGHAGTTPMGHRADAMLGAARLITAVNQMPGLGQCHVATVGHLDVQPNSANTIAGRARLTVDLRDLDATRLGTAERTVRDTAADIAGDLRLDVRCERLARSQPTATNSDIRTLISDSADALGLQSLILPSGAGHDAQILAAVTSIGMIFVPSIGGDSHVPQENTCPEDLVAGARVLLGTVLRTPALRPA